MSFDRGVRSAGPSRCGTGFRSGGHRRRVLYGVLPWGGIDTRVLFKLLLPLVMGIGCELLGGAWHRLFREAEFDLTVLGEGISADERTPIDVGWFEAGHGPGFPQKSGAWFNAYGDVRRSGKAGSLCTPWRDKSQSSS